MKIIHFFLLKINQINSALKESPEMFRHEISTVGKSIIDVVYKDSTKTIYEINIAIHDTKDANIFIDMIEFYTGEAVVGTIEELLLGKVKIRGYKVKGTSTSLKLKALT